MSQEESEDRAGWVGGTEKEPGGLPGDGTLTGGAWKMKGFCAALPGRNHPASPITVSYGLTSSQKSAPTPPAPCPERLPTPHAKPGLLLASPTPRPQFLERGVPGCPGSCRAPLSATSLCSGSYNITSLLSVPLEEQTLPTLSLFQAGLILCILRLSLIRRRVEGLHGPLSPPPGLLPHLTLFALEGSTQNVLLGE